MNLAVIPARGGSKRIPKKNIRSFAGRPMIEWPIEAARLSGLFERIVVSTDSEEVAAVARNAGAEVPFVRPPELSSDHCGTLEVVSHAARWAVREGLAPEAICCLYATAAFAAPGDMARGFDALREGVWDFVFGASRFCQPVQRAFLRAEDGSMALLFPEHRLTRSQDLPTAYHDAGQFYWGRFDAWIAERPIFGPHTSFIEFPPDGVRDIDTPEDWTMAELMFEMMKRTRNEQ